MVTGERSIALDHLGSKWGRNNDLPSPKSASKALYGGFSASLTENSFYHKASEVAGGIMTQRIQYSY